MLATKYLLLAPFFLVYLYGTEASIKILTKSLNTDKELWYSNKLSSSRLTYLLCEQRFNVDYLARDCQVIREKSPFSNETDSCNVTLKLNQSSAKLSETPISIGAVTLANDVVLLYMAEKSYNPYVKFVTVNFNDCKVLGENEIRVFNPAESADQAVRVVPFDDCYEVHYLEQQEHVADLIHSRIAIDVEGKIIDGPNVVETVQHRDLYLRTPLPDLFPIARESRDKGVVYLKIRNDTVLPRMTVLQTDGTKQNFEVLGGNKDSWKNVSDYILFSLSTDQDVISVCSTVSFDMPTFKCLQFNADGKLNFATDFIEDRDTKYLNIATYNLPDGGFLAAAFNYYKLRGPPKSYDLSIFKFDSKGKVVGKVFLKNFDSQGAYNHVMLFYTNEKDEYCLKAPIYDGETKKDLKLTAHCFTDADFAPYTSDLLNVV